MLMYKHIPDNHLEIAMGDVDALSKKGQESKKTRKRVNAAGKKPKKAKKKVAAVENEENVENMVKQILIK